MINLAKIKYNLIIYMPPKKIKKQQIQITEPINFYELQDVQAYVTPSHNPNYDLHQIKVPFRAVIIGASGSMKSNLVLNLLQIMNETFTRIELYCRSSQEPLYQFLENKLDHSCFTIKEGLEDFNSQDLNKVYTKDDNTLVIFDDLCLEQNQSKISELYIRGRKLNVSTLYLTQKYFKVPTAVRGQVSYIFIKKIAGKNDLRRILADTSLGATIDELYNMYQYCIRSSPTAFLLIDLEAPQERQYRRNFCEYLNAKEFSNLNNPN